MASARVGVRAPGEFCWFNMLTPAPEAARAFFTAVLGWAYAEIPYAGHTVLAGASGEPMGGLFDVVSAKTPNGAPPAITPMIKVGAIDDGTARVGTHGGTVHEVLSIGENLRMAVCVGPDGASVDLWEDGKAQGMRVAANVVGAPSWHQLHTPDVDGAAAFYAGTFGWTTAAGAEPTGTNLAWLGGHCLAGLSYGAPNSPPGPVRWTTYFAVRDVDEAVAAAVALGAQVLSPAHDLAGVGRLARLTSPQGVAFGVVQRGA